MKIGILTFHRGVNAGGFLQARGLFTYLSGLGHEVEIIDYMNEGQRRIEHDGIYRTRHPLRRWNNVRKLKRFQKAMTRLPMGPPIERVEEIDWTGYDEIVFGSDEIWNLASSYAGGDLTFFGAGMSRSRKSSYAPSFGSTPANHQALADLPPLLADFELITVRDEHSAAIIKKLTGRTPPLVVDPVLLSEPDEVIPHQRATEAIGVYFMAPRPDDVRRIRKFAAKQRRKLCSIGYYYEWADRNLAGLDPGEIPGTLAGCRLVITNTFHGVIFSLKNRVPFVIIDHPAKNRKINTLRRKLGLATVFDGDGAIEEGHINQNEEEGELMAAWITESKSCLNSRFAPLDASRA